MRSSFLHIATALIAWVLAASAMAQPDDLARDFEKLSAKERARIAKEEQEAARNDVGYQALMAQAEQLFQQSRYEEAVARYEEARVLRPYNVYPKVKIQDLQALIAKRDAAKAEAPPPQAPEPDPPTPTDPKPAVEVPAQAPSRLVIGAPAVQPAPEPISRPLPKTVPRPSTTPAASPAAVQERPSPKVPLVAPPELVEGERVYKEGRAVVMERSIAQEGHIVVYRKVTHPWGEVNHFKDGIAVPARVYEQAMQGR